MPAHPDEIVQAEAEGVRFVCDVAPISFKGNGRLAAVVLQRMRPGAPDSSGRPRPEPVPGSEIEIAAAHALTAIGEEVDFEVFDPVVDSSRGRICADLWGRTTLPAVFAGGDAATGAGMVVNAIGSGRLAAQAIDAWLAGRDPSDEGLAERTVARETNFFYFPPSPRSRMPYLPPEAAVRSMQEVARGLDWSAAMREAGRCLTCGSCTECDNCLVFCPDAAVHHDGPGSAYRADLSHCKGCGICAAECPRGAVMLVPEESR
jgi:NADPH-dependent glutamate synthase beta subunit-like oxidoreductase